MNVKEAIKEITLSGGKIVLRKPKQPEYVTLESRKNSLSALNVWPSVQTTEHLVKLAEAGFFWDGQNKQLVCFHCNEVLDFTMLTLEDSPWTNHLTISPGCMYVRLCKGDNFVLDFLTGNPVRNDNESDFMNECCRKSFSEGEEDNKVEDCMDDMNKTEVKLIQKESEKMINEWICKICLSSMACVVILPCGHLCCCPQCISACKTCPICRGVLNGFIRARTAGYKVQT